MPKMSVPSPHVNIESFIVYVEDRVQADGKESVLAMTKKTGKLQLRLVK